MPGDPGRSTAPGKGMLRDIEIRTARLSLRPFDPTDASDIYRAITPSLTRYMRWDPPASPDAFEEIWRSWLIAFQEGTDIHFVARNSTDGTFTGLIGLHNLGEIRPEIGLWIKEAVQNTGYGRESLTAVIQWASARFAPQGFVYPVAEQNKFSRKLAEALGGVIVGRRSNAKYSAFIYHIAG
jgi:RimJ/RimL family protein N-acetyltransferase